jgi:Domain of unknown function (DUF6484)
MAAVTDRTPETKCAGIEQWVDSTRLGGVNVVEFAGFDSDERFLIRSAADATPAPAASTIGLDQQDVGVEVVVVFERGDAMRPIIVGRLNRKAKPAAAGSRVTLDGDRLVLQADRQIEMRCGDSSIVLTRAGKVLIKGAYVLTRSSGANRIKGAYVDIN